jgi:hypothetical protein
VNDANQRIAQFRQSNKGYPNLDTEFMVRLIDIVHFGASLDIRKAIRLDMMRLWD